MLKQSLMIVPLFFFNISGVYAQSMTTGLGECVDFVGMTSATLISQVNDHSSARLYGLPSRYDPATGNIYVPPYSCDSSDLNGLFSTIGYLSHELGHHVAGIPNISAPITKGEYVSRMCVWEARAVTNNAVVRDEASSSSQGYVAVPLIAQNASAIDALIASGAAPQEIGAAFCDGNTNSSGKTYTQFHNDHYDANYPW